MKFPKLITWFDMAKVREYTPIGVFGEEVIETVIVTDGSLVANVLHSVSTVDYCKLKLTFVSDSLLGNGPGKTNVDL